MAGINWAMLILSAVMSVVATMVTFYMQRRVKRFDELESRISAVEHELATMKENWITKDDIREIITSALNEFQLNLINNGQLAPKVRKGQQT